MLLICCISKYLKYSKLGANIECSSKNLVDFSIMGASLYKSLYPNETPNTALLNIGSEELKGN